jgi:plastocyanin
VHRVPARSLLVALTTILVLSGCNGAPENATTDATADDTVSVVGRDNLTWDTESLSASAGTITVELSCEDAVNHNLVIEETDEVVAECAPGETVTGTVDLEPGEYTYICTIPGHESTMRGTLTVE